MRGILIASLLLTTLAVCPGLPGQTRSSPGDTAAAGPAGVFRAIERGVSAGDVRLLSAYFDRTVSLSIPGAGTGYYSANQAGEVLRHFLESRNLSSFTFTTSRGGDHPFATGAAMVTAGGRIERLQIYVGLTSSRAGWLITQFNIY